MYVVALTRWGRPMDDELPILAPWIGSTAYDLRLRVAGTLPAVLLATGDPSQAGALRAALRERGHGAVAIDERSVAGPDAQTIPREFTLGERAFSGRELSGRPFEVPYAELLALVRASRVSVSETTTTSRQKKLDLGRTVLSGGLIMRRAVEEHAHHTSEQREQVLYLFERDLGPPTLLSAESLRYSALGDALDVSTLRNFETLVGALRSRAPHAFYDDRFLASRRKGGTTAVRGGASERTVTTSNASENDLAVTLLVCALRAGQL